MAAARAFPPRLPSSAAADFAESGSSSVSSPVAIRMTLTALPITSAGRFSPLGPRGIFGHHTKRPSFTNSLLHPDRDGIEIILEKLDLCVYFTIG
jgi:hypothetical protein